MSDISFRSDGWPSNPKNKQVEYGRHVYCSWFVLFQDSQWKCRSRSYSRNRNFAVLNIDNVENMIFLNYTLFSLMMIFTGTLSSLSKLQAYIPVFKAAEKEDLLVCFCSDLHAFFHFILSKRKNEEFRLT